MYVGVKRIMQNYTFNFFKQHIKPEKVAIAILCISRPLRSWNLTTKVLPEEISTNYPIRVFIMISENIISLLLPLGDVYKWRHTRRGRGGAFRLVWRYVT